ncbi:chemotaxis response regulator protein-glutamate methylesterase [Thermodesulfobacteriota bacterium]
MEKIRILIVDDSPVVQLLLGRILSAEPDMEVLGTASDPIEASRWIRKEKPDVVTLDIEMPRLDGITFLKRLMSYRPVPVIMISSYTRKNSMQTIEALAAGAVDFVTKPTGSDLETGFVSLRDEIVAKIRAVSNARVKPPIMARNTVQKIDIANPDTINQVIAIGASTGGTQIIQNILAGISFLCRGIVIVQHMPEKYTLSFAKRLDQMLPFDVQEARDKDLLDHGKIFICPGMQQMRVVREKNGLMIRLDRVKPSPKRISSVDALFHSVAENIGREAVGIILSGMGTDGAEGLLAMKRAGAYTIAQDKESCVVFGMPGAAINRGGARIVASPKDIPALIFTNGQRGVRNRSL